MPQLAKSPWERHTQRWGNCTRCPLHQRRKHVCLLRGKVPCDVLFIGEAPGASENLLGSPFIGPAGRLLDLDQLGFQPGIIQRAGFKRPLRWAFTNVVGCIPLDSSNTKTAEPPAVAIKACAPRLAELIHICRPRAIVRVGALATKHITSSARYKVADIHHPAFILRMEPPQRSLAIKRTVVILQELLEELGYELD